jgi:hypothetical protein
LAPNSMQHCRSHRGTWRQTKRGATPCCVREGRGGRRISSDQSMGVRRSTWQRAASSEQRKPCLGAPLRPAKASEAVSQIREKLNSPFLRPKTAAKPRIKGSLVGFVTTLPRYRPAYFYSSTLGSTATRVSPSSISNMGGPPALVVSGIGTH